MFCVLPKRRSEVVLPTADLFFLGQSSLTAKKVANATAQIVENQSVRVATVAVLILAAFGQKLSQALSHMFVADFATLVHVAIDTVAFPEGVRLY